MSDNKNNQEIQAFNWDDIETFWNDIKMMARKLLANQSEKYSWWPTALTTEALRRIHERNGKWNEVTWNSRGAFFKHCNLAMRHAIKDRHRVDSAIKRPSKALTKSLDSFFETHSPIAFVKENPKIFITFEQAVDQIAKNDQDLALLIYYRFLF